MANFRRFNATNEPHTCLWCGLKLKPAYQYEWVPGERSVNALGHEELTGGYGKKGDLIGYGYNGTDAFCGLRCGYLFALSASNSGFRLQPRQP